MPFGGRVLGAILLVGVGAAAVATVVAAPTILRRARPFVREGLRRGMSLYERARGAATEFTEDVEDLVAEVKSDISSERAAQPVAPVSPVAAAKEA